MMDANLSAWMLPVMRIVRWRSPNATLVVRVTATVFCAAGLAGCVFQKKTAAAMRMSARTSQSPVRRGLGGVCRTISGFGVPVFGAGLLVLGVGALVIKICT